MKNLLHQWFRVYKKWCKFCTRMEWSLVHTLNTLKKPNEHAILWLCINVNIYFKMLMFSDLNLLHWSTSIDLLAVALDNSVYIWTPSSGDINHLCELEEPDSYVTSVQWIEQGNHLAVGTVSGAVQVRFHHSEYVFELPCGYG